MIEMTSWNNMAGVLSIVKWPRIGSRDSTDLITFADTVSEDCNLEQSVEQLFSRYRVDGRTATGDGPWTRNLISEGHSDIFRRVR